MATVTILAPPGAGLKYEIPSDGVLVLGRGPECDVVLKRQSISRRHAQITARDDEFTLEDLRSTNGTFVNGNRIHGPSRLQDGDVINLHDVPLGFATDASDQFVAGDDTAKFRAGETVPLTETDHAMPIAPGAPGASILKGRLKSLIEIARHVGGALDPTLLPPKILDLVFKMFPQLSLGEIFIADEDGKLTMATQRRGDMSASAVVSTAPTDSGLVHDVWESGEGRIQASEDSHGESVFDDRSVCSLCAPIIGMTQTNLGVIYLQTDDLLHAFHRDDLELASAVGIVAGQAVEFSRAHQIILEHEQTQHHLEIARTIQTGMLPRSRPTLAGYEFADYYAPARTVGGDYYFYEQLADGRVLLGIADAAGKGFPAAITIARFAGEVRARIATSRTLKEAMLELNRFVLDCGPANFITCSVCVLDPKKHTVTLAEAGHLPPLCRRASNPAVVRWSNPRGGFPFGISEKFECHPSRHQLEPGDLMILYTDGLSEAMNPENELFGENRLIEELSNTHDDAPTMVKRIVNSIDEFRQGRAPSDDMCLLALQRLT